MTGCRLRSETVILSVSYRVVCVWNRLQSEGGKGQTREWKKNKRPRLHPVGSTRTLHVVRTIVRVSKVTVFELYRPIDGQPVLPIDASTMETAKGLLTLLSPFMAASRYDDSSCAHSPTRLFIPFEIWKRQKRHLKLNASSTKTSPFFTKCALYLN